MKNERQIKKLTIRKQTVRDLTSDDLARAQGALITTPPFSNSYICYCPD